MRSLIQFMDPRAYHQLKSWFLLKDYGNKVIPSVDPSIYLSNRSSCCNWAQIHNQSLAATIHRVLSCTLHFRAKPQIGLPGLLHCALPSEQPFSRSSEDWNLTNRTEIFLVQLELCSQPILTNQDSAFWTNVKIWSAYSHRDESIRLGSDTLLYISQLHPCFNGVYFQFPSRLRSPDWSCNTQAASSELSHSQAVLQLSCFSHAVRQPSFFTAEFLK